MLYSCLLFSIISVII